MVWVSSAKAYGKCERGLPSQPRRLFNTGIDLKVGNSSDFSASDHAGERLDESERQVETNHDLKDRFLLSTRSPPYDLMPWT